MGDVTRPTAYETELLLVSVFQDSRLRSALNRLKMRFWSVSESGAFGWLGDQADRLEHFLARRTARRNLRRKSQTIDQSNATPKEQ